MTTLEKRLHNSVHSYNLPVTNIIKDYLGAQRGGTVRSLTEAEHMRRIGIEAEIRDFMEAKVKEAFTGA